MEARVLKKVVFFALLALSIIACGKKEETKGEAQKETPKETKIKIGITQIVEHPALDAARKGFMEVLQASEFGSRIEFDEKSAQGDMTVAQNIANEFVSGKKDMILAVATPTAQAAYNVTKDIPILITAVTDPVKAGLTGSNITGTSDATPIDKQFDLLKKIYPNAKKVGIIYNIGEQNSEVQVAQAEEIAKKYGLTVEKVGISTVNEVAQAIDALLAKVDVLYTPTDNLVASAMPLISEKSLAAKKAVIGAEKGQVESGALATEGIDYYELGKQTGQMALEVLKGAKPNTLPIKTLEKTELVINTKIAEKLGLTIPADLLDKATKI